MTSLWLNYVPVLFLILVAFFVILLLFFVSFFLGASSSSLDFEKLSTYECGFEPFSTTQGTFDVNFYLLAMLFMVFDLEIIYILPWSVCVDEATFFSFLVMLWFSFALTIAFIYEWFSGALDWQ